MSPALSEARSSGLNRPEKKKERKIMRRSSSRFLSVEKKKNKTTMAALIALLVMLCFGDLTTTFTTTRSGPRSSSFSSSSFKGENGSFKSGFTSRVSETDNTRKESQSQRRIYHVYVKVVCRFLSFSPSRGDICVH